MNPPKIFVDFNNADKNGRVRLNVSGSVEDIKSNGIILQNGLLVLLDDDDGLKTLGKLTFSEEENIWVAEIDWKDLER